MRAPTRFKPVDAIIGRHDGCGIEARGIDQPQPQLAFRPAAAGACKVRREVALEPLFRKRAAVAQDAGAAALDHERAAARRIAGVPVSDVGMASPTTA